MLRGAFRYLSANARCRAQEARLLPPEWFEQLAGTNSIEDVFSLLAATDYGPFIPGETPPGLWGLESCLLSRRVSLEHELAFILPRESRDLLTALSRRRDVRNLKALARGIAAEIPADRLPEYLVPGGIFPDSFLNLIREQNDLEGIRTSLTATEYWPGLESLGPVSGIPDLPRFEASLDRTCWQLLRKVLEDPNLHKVFPHFLAQTQFRDLLLIFQARLDDIEPGPVREWLLEPDTLGPGVFRAYESEAGTGTFSEILSASLFSDLDTNPFLSEETGQISLFPLETQMENHLDQLARDLSLVHPYGFPPVWAYLWSQENELRHILRIAKAKELGLNREETRKTIMGTPAWKLQ